MCSDPGPGQHGIARGVVKPLNMTSQPGSDGETSDRPPPPHTSEARLPGLAGHERASTPHGRTRKVLRISMPIVPVGDVSHKAIRRHWAIQMKITHLVYAPPFTLTAQDNCAQVMLASNGWGNDDCWGKKGEPWIERR
ncbi:hypothetical protein DENSPDRAFT_670579 [Dentipellis sp. KUC8613]|nr:hypothetical protein DENSPDRAFT_670579 [Dentipellis sp. KUC8613]